MSWTQIVLQFSGWGLIIYLHNRTLRRAELARLKDTIITQLNESNLWLINELKLEQIQYIRTERLYTAKVNQIEFKLNQLNLYAKENLIPPAFISKIWDIDIEDMHKRQESEADLHEITNDLIEEIERLYCHKLFHTNIIRYFYQNCRPEFLGSIFALLMLYFSYNIFHILFS